MFRRSVRLSLFAFVLLLGLFVVSTAPALAQGATSHPTAVVNTGALNVRSGPEYTFARITTLYQGQEVLLLARYSQNEWVKVRIPNGIEGWVNSRYLLTSVPISSLPVVGPPTYPPPPSSTPPPTSTPPASSYPTGKVITGALNVRGGPNYSYGVVAVLQYGDVVQLLARDANSQWVMIRTQAGVQGWVNSGYLQTSVPVSSLPVASNPPTVPGTGPTGIVTTGTLNVRQGPGMAYPSITTVMQGQTVYLLGRNAAGTWLMIRTSEGAQGWANASHIQESVPVSSLPVVGTAPPANRATVSVGALNVRVAPGPDFPIVTTVTYGMELGLLGRNTSGSWVKVQTPGGSVGWVNSTYIIPSVPISSLPIVG